MTQEATAMRPWRFVVCFGTVRLLADFVHEGARPVTGPLLASLGASAAVVGAVTGGMLIVLPVLSAAMLALVFTDSLAPVVLGALVWGAATGVQESPLRAVADLVAPGRSVTASSPRSWVWPRSRGRSTTSLSSR
ncbi:hypothetical protein [Streptomyces sp. NPDC055134]